MSERVWGIPCPWSGDDNDAMDWRYRLWFALYRANQRVRHVVGLHQKPRTYSIAPRCDWCGHRSAKQRAIADEWARGLGDEPDYAADLTAALGTAAQDGEAGA